MSNDYVLYTPNIKIYKKLLPLKNKCVRLDKKWNWWDVCKMDVTINSMSNFGVGREYIFIYYLSRDARVDIFIVTKSTRMFLVRKKNRKTCFFLFSVLSINHVTWTHLKQSGFTFVHSNTVMNEFQSWNRARSSKSYVKKLITTIPQHHLTNNGSS